MRSTIAMVFVCAMCETAIAQFVAINSNTFTASGVGSTTNFQQGPPGITQIRYNVVDPESNSAILSPSAGSGYSNTALGISSSGSGSAQHFLGLFPNFGNIDRIVQSASASMSNTNNGNSNSASASTGEAHYTISFTVSSPVNYNLDAMTAYSLTASGTITSQIRFSDSSNNSIAALLSSSSLNTGNLSQNFNGTLSNGTYILAADLSAQ